MNRPRIRRYSKQPTMAIQAISLIEVCGTATVKLTCGCKVQYYGKAFDKCRFVDKCRMYPSRKKRDERFAEHAFKCMQVADSKLLASSPKAITHQMTHSDSGGSGNTTDKTAEGRACSQLMAGQREAEALLPLVPHHGV
jgi:hypothetical protein